MIHVTKRTIDALNCHAEEEYPEECCGYIWGLEDPESWTVNRCRNIQNSLHASDPVRYPRDARTAYTFDADDMAALFHSSPESEAHRVIAFYHSHPDHAAYFSEKDKDEALVGWLEPEPLYLVLSVEGGQVLDMKAYMWRSDRDEFEERDIEMASMNTSDGHRA